MKRREFIKRSGIVVGAAASSTLPSISFAGKRVESMKLLTANASFDPVRPEMGRLISQACKGIGWDVELAAEDYNLGIQKVFKEFDFDMHQTHHYLLLLQYSQDGYKLQQQE